MMTDELKNHVVHATDQMQKVIEHLESALLKIRAGKASTQLNSNPASTRRTTSSMPSKT